jgi:L,D-transpeptidase ErfK/SrfK
MLFTMKNSFIRGIVPLFALFIWLGEGLALAGEERADIQEKTGISTIEPPPSISQSIPRRFALNAGEELIGRAHMQHQVSKGETLMELARLYGMGFNEIALANAQVDPWAPQPGTRLNGSFIRILPGLDSFVDIIINIPEMRLYHRVKPGWVDTYPIGVGRIGFSTPKGEAELIRKRAGPSWYVPESIRKEKPHLPAVVPPGPDNPLGTHALYLSLPGYLLHGTNQPLGIGRRVSHGCIRLYPEDVGLFFANTKVGARVRLIHEPVKAGWRGGQLYIEVHPVFEESKGEMGAGKLQEVATTVINRALARRPEWVVALDWREIDRAISRPDGMPHPVGRLRVQGDG